MLTGCSYIYPGGMVEETLKTLSLLLPPDDESREWYIRQQIRFHFDGRAIGYKELTEDERRIEKFE
jgi:hypothetical protein